MAILKINHDRYNQGTLDNFLPMVADRLFHSKSEVLAVTDLRDEIGSEYGLWIPLGVLSSIARRAARKKLVKREGGEYIIDRDAVKDCDLTATRSQVRRAHKLVISAGVNFVEERFERSISESEFELALDRYIQANAAPLLSSVVDARRIAVDPGPGAPQEDVMVAAFISDLAERSPQLFDHLSDVVKGSVLATALYFPDEKTFSQKLTNLQVFLDTTLLLRAVGACGPDLQEVSREIVALCTARGAKLRCFRHSIDEVQGILRYCMVVTKNPSVAANGEASEYMVSAGWEYSDVVQLSDSLEDTLGEAGIQIVKRPDHEEYLTLDEPALEALLQERVSYKRPEARRKDLDSVSAVYRLRRGDQTRSLAKARAIFVTTNSRFVQAVRKYERIEQTDRETVPLCIRDYVLASILWLMQPLAAPDLPIRRLVADSYATMRADETKWHQYLEKIEKLQSEPTIAPEQITLLRSSLDVRALVLVETEMEPESFTVGTARSVLDKYHKNLTTEARKDVRLANERVKAIELELSRRDAFARTQIADREREIDAKNRLIERNAKKLAKLISIAVMSLAAAAIIIGAVLGPSSYESAGPLGVVVSACAVLFLVLSLADLITGHGVPWLHTRLQRLLTPVLDRWLRRDTDAL